MNVRLARELLLLSTFAFFLSAAPGCGDSDPSAPTSASTRSETTQRKAQGPADDVVRAFQDAWNVHYGGQALGVGFRYEGTIDDAAEAQQLLARLTDPTTAYAPTGFANDPASVMAVPLSALNYQPPVYDAYVASNLQVGLHYYTLEWVTAAGDPFQSTFVCTASGAPVFGSMYSATLFETVPKTVPGVEYAKGDGKCADFDLTRTLRMYWVWPLDDVERGKASLTVHVECDCEGADCVTTDEDITDVVEDAEIGTAHAKAQFITDEFGNREVLIALTVSTATADVKISFDVEHASVSFEMEGVGTSFTRQYNLSVDCVGSCSNVEGGRVRDLIPMETGRI